MGTFNFFLKPYKDINNADERITMLFQRYGGMVRLSPNTPDEMSRGYIAVVAPGLNSDDTYAMADICNSLGRYGSDITVQDMERFKCEKLRARISKYIDGWEQTASKAMNDYGADSLEYGYAREVVDALKMFRRDVELNPSQFKSRLRYYFVEAVNALKSGEDTTVGKARAWTTEYKKGYLAGEAYAANLCLGMASEADDLPLQTWIEGGPTFRKSHSDVATANLYFADFLYKFTLTHEGFIVNPDSLDTQSESSVQALAEPKIEINDSALFSVTVNGAKLSPGDLADLHSYYEACCTAEHLKENYKLESDEEAISLGYDVRYQMDKYGYDEDYAISEVMEQYLKHSIGET